MIYQEVKTTRNVPNIVATLVQLEQYQTLLCVSNMHGYLLSSSFWYLYLSGSGYLNRCTWSLNAVLVVLILWSAEYPGSTFILRALPSISYSGFNSFVNSGTVNGLLFRWIVSLNSFCFWIVFPTAALSSSNLSQILLPNWCLIFGGKVTEPWRGVRALRGSLGGGGFIPSTREPLVSPLP